MKKYFALFMTTALLHPLSQAQPNILRKNTNNNLQTVTNKNASILIPTLVKPKTGNASFIAYRANLPMTNTPAQSGGPNFNKPLQVMDAKQGNSNQVMRMNQSQGDNTKLNGQVNMAVANTTLNQNYTLSKKNNDGSTTRYTLTHNISGWDARPQIDAKQTSATGDFDDPSWKCTNSVLNFNSRSTSFMNALPGFQASYLVPGMIYSYDDYSSGNFNEKLNVDRNPVVLTCDVYNADKIKSTVSNPGLSNLRIGLDSIVKNFAPQQSGASYQMNTTMVDNENELNLVANAGGSFGGFSISANFNHSENSHHIYYTVDAIKTLYTINTELPSMVYSKTDNLPSTNSPAIMIKSVTYGARVLANMDIELNDKSDMSGMSLSYNSGFTSGSFDFNSLFKNKSVNITINGYLIGFPSNINGTFNATADNFFSMLDQFFSKCDYVSAKPIQYSFSDMGGDLLGVESATDKFSIRNCTPADEIFVLQSALVNFNTGQDDKNTDSEFWLSLATGNPNSLSWISNYYDKSSSFNNKGNPYTLNLPLYNNQKMEQADVNEQVKQMNQNLQTYALTMDDFKSGGAIGFKLIQHNHMHDDWDFSSFTLILNFMSQKGTELQKQVQVGSNFRISEVNDNPNNQSKIIYFDNNFNSF
jgi:hypothetical protein